jgi:integrase
MKIEDIKNSTPGSILRDKGEAGSVKGLHVRVSPIGTKTFMLYYRTKAGKERRPKIGVFGEITLAEARKRAKRILDLVAVGEDPQGDWSDARSEMNVSELYAVVLEKHWGQDRYVKSGHKYNVELNWKKHLAPKFANLKLSEVTPVIIDAWHSKFTGSPYAGNRSLENLSTMFTYAERFGLRPLGMNPCKVVGHHTERSRTRFASHDEIRQLAAIMDRAAETQPAPVAFLYLLLFTGSRPRLIERAKWNQLKTFVRDGVEYGVLTLEGKSTEKTGDEDSVVIPPQAMRVLAKLPRIEGQTITGIKHPKRFWAKIRKEAGITNLWARDFRRTFATVANSMDISLNTIGELLNHKSTQTTSIYAKLFDGIKVDAANKVAGEIESILAKK